MIISIKLRMNTEDKDPTKYKRAPINPTFLIEIKWNKMCARIPRKKIVSKKLLCLSIRFVSIFVIVLKRCRFVHATVMKRKP